MSTYRLQKGDLGRLLNKVIKESDLYAPVKTDLVRFARVDDAKEVCLAENSFFPVKEEFFRKHETILRWDGKRFAKVVPASKPRVFFGVRRCDLNAIAHQDVVFLSEPMDPFYAAQREGALLIGLHCKEAPSEYCFCGSLDLKDFYDLMFFDKGKYYLVDVGTNAGERFVSKHKAMFRPANQPITPKDRQIKGADRLRNTDISALYDHPDWQKGVDLCLSCAACTNLCPTCYCFEFSEKADLFDSKRSERVRSWSSCQLKEFTKVAGGFVFRNNRSERFRHRIYHQLDYFKKKNGFNLCVGCGRCIAACPTRIDFVDIINNMGKQRNASK